MERQVALVTGASRGIGRGIALELGSLGFAVVVNYRKDATAAEETAKGVERRGGVAFPLQGDVGIAEDRRRILQEPLDRFGRLDLLVNNAGVAPVERKDLLEITEESYDRVMNTNLKGPFFLTQEAAKVMIELKRQGKVFRPKIVNIGSVSAYAVSVTRAEYCLSKAGLSMMTALFADRLAEEGMAVYEIRPGVIESDMTVPVREKYDHRIADGLTPIRRWGTPEDVGKAVVAIAQDLLPFSTGEVINVDGGFHLVRL